MRTLLLRLAGPTQTWDGQRARAQARWTPALAPILPTSTGVVGLLGAALGRPRDADMEDLRGLTMVIRIDQAGTPRSEFWVSQRQNSQGKTISAPMRETVLDDAVFLVGVGGDAQLVDEAAAALLKPVFPLHLGKRAYPATLPIRVGVVDGDPESAVWGHPWLAAPWWRRSQPTTVSLTVRYPRREPRHLAHSLPPLPALPGVIIDNPDGTTEPHWTVDPREIDWLAALDISE